jgi:hypothetical protein
MAKLGVLGNLSVLYDVNVVTYINCADYKIKTGADASVFDPTKPIKNWVFKVEPKEQDDMPGAVAYKTFIDDVSKPVPRDGSGRPMLRTYFIPKDVWDKINLPPDSGRQIDGVRKVYPVPFRELKDNEDIQPAEVTPFNLHFSVVDKTEYKSQDQVFTDKQRRDDDLYNMVIAIYNTVVKNN